MTPDNIIELYQRTQVDIDMDRGTYLGGSVDRIIEAIAGMVGWVLPPRMSLAEREQYLRDQGREDEIEYLGVNGDE